MVAMVSAALKKPLLMACGVGSPKAASRIGVALAVNRVAWPRMGHLPGVAEALRVGKGDGCGEGGEGGEEGGGSPCDGCVASFFVQPKQDA